MPVGMGEWQSKQAGPSESWEILAEDPMKMVFNSLFKQSFNHILEVVRSMETELAMSHAAIVEVAVRSFGSKVTGASPGSNPRTSWWTTKVKWAVKLKKETYKV